MTIPLSRRDLFKTLTAAGCVAALPQDRAGAGPRAIATGLVAGKMTGAEALAETLLQEGAGCVFGIPGAQGNELWDTIKAKGLGYLLVTHEFSASIMADGWARATGRPGVLCVVPGPGVTNALTGLGEALLDSVPIVAIVGDVAQGDKYRAFQVHELPQAALLRPVTKEVICVRAPEEVADAVRKAFWLARAGEPGPVAVVVPYNFLTVQCHYHSPELPPPALPFDEAGFQRALGLLADRGKRVGIYAGMGCMDQGPLLAQVADLLQAPVATSVSGKGVIPECHPLAVGWGYGPHATGAAEKAFQAVDLVLAVGVKYSEVSTGFYSIPPRPHAIHVDVNPQNLGRNLPSALCVNAEAGHFLGRLLAQGDGLRRFPDGALVAAIRQWKAEDARRNAAVYGQCGADPMLFVQALRRCTREDALVYTDVTMTEHFAAEAFTVTRPRTYFNPADNQAMGWSIPAALGGQRAFPGRQVVTITGDGCFLMSAMEISTAAREQLPVKFFILDDQAYHYMQAVQKPAYGRTTATWLAHLDYAALAKGLGVAYQEIVGNDGLEAGIGTALAHCGPVLCRVAIDYGKRPVRWISAVRKRYLEEMSTDQKVRFAARLGARALGVQREND